MARPSPPWSAALLSLPLAACLGRVPAPAVWPLRADDPAANGWSRDCDLLQVSLDVTLDLEGRRVYGSATSWIRALREGTATVTLHGVGIDVRGIQDSRGRELFFELAPPAIVVTLAEPLARGQEERLRVAYVAEPAQGMFFRGGPGAQDGASGAGGDTFDPQVWTQGQFEDNRHWLPVWDYPNDRATYEAKIRVGHDMTAISNGELVDVEVHGGGERTFHWRMRDDLATYLIAIAAGRWETYEDRWRGVPVYYHVAPGTGEDRARGALGETPQMMEFFSELLDYPYPYPKYDQAVVADFTWGGMENSTITILADYIIGDAGERGDLDGDPRLLVAHELAHQWFGDLVTCLGWSHLWLNEAWASYLELRYERHVTDEGNYQLWLERYRERYLASRDDSAWPVALDWRSQGSAPERANHVYDKGPWVLHMLERELGSVEFWHAARTYLKRYANGLATTYDFARAIFDATGHNVEGFLEQWVFAGGHPVLDVRHELRPAPDAQHTTTLDLRVRQVQPFEDYVPLFGLVLEVDLFLADGQVVRQRLDVREEREQFLLELPAGLVDLVVDPDASLLAELQVHKDEAMWAHQAGLFDSPASQWRALPALRRMADRSNVAAVALMRLLVESPQPLLRQRAARLCDFDDPRARLTLVNAVTRDPQARVRLEAAQTLSRHAAREQSEPGSTEYQAFLSRLQVETSPAVRRELERLIGIPGPEEGGDGVGE